MPPIKIHIDGIGSVKLATQHGYDNLLENEGVKFLLDKEDQAQVLYFGSLVDGGAYTLSRTQEKPQHQQHPQQQSEEKSLHEIKKKLDLLEEGGPNSPGQEKNQPQPQQQQLEPFGKHRCRLYYHHGQWSIIPEDWRFPRVTVLEAWRQWCLGDPEKNIPPLHFLAPEDVKWLAQVPLNKEELKGRMGKFQDRRRNPRKTLFDLRFLMKFIIGLVKAKGKYVDPNVATADDVDAMFNSISNDEDAFFCRYDEDEYKNEDGAIDELNKKQCSKKWVTIVNEIRQKRRNDSRQRDEAQCLENNKRKRLNHDASTLMLLADTTLMHPGDGGGSN
ncbi:hypothetical protein ACA910_007625 [Epithemia clementina (nom. ined.)]